MQMEPSTSEFAGDEADNDDVENEETPEVRLVPSDASACASKQPSVMAPMVYCLWCGFKHMFLSSVMKTTVCGVQWKTFFRCCAIVRP